jgi:hypothetical protein
MTPSDWAARQRQLRNVALANLSALLVDLVLVNIHGEVSGALWLLAVGVGIFLIATIAITALLLLAVDRLRSEEPESDGVRAHAGWPVLRRLRYRTAHGAAKRGVLECRRTGPAATLESILGESDKSRRVGVRQPE